MKKLLMISTILLTACVGHGNVVRLKDVSFCQEINHQTSLKGNKIICRLLWCEHDVVDEAALEKANPLDDSANGAVKQRSGGVTTLWCIPNSALPGDDESVEEKKNLNKFKSSVIPSPGPIQFELSDGETYQSMPNLMPKRTNKFDVSSIDNMVDKDYKAMPLVLKMSNK